MSQDDEHTNADTPGDESSEIEDMTEGTELSPEDIDYLTTSGELGEARRSVRRWTIGGAIVGLVIGFSFLPSGLFLGPIIGAVVLRFGRRARIGIGRAAGRAFDKLPSSAQAALGIAGVVLFVVVIAVRCAT